jgi:hypothetical protein
MVYLKVFRGKRQGRLKPSLFGGGFGWGIAYSSIRQCHVPHLTSPKGGGTQERLPRSLHSLWVTIIFILYINNGYATPKTPHISYGGVVNMTFGRLAGENDGQSRPSGYGWWSSYHKLNDTYYVTGNAGISLLERKPIQTTYNRVQSVYTPILNDLSIGLQSNIEQFTIGRTLNAAGKLHHDISDFGAPGGGMDNTPVSSFFNGSYTTNVSQQIANSFAKRVSYYIKPFEADYGNINFGISYAPKINPYHPENYAFFAGTETPFKNEVSFAGSTEFDVDKFTIGLTAGHTQGERPFNRQLPTGIIIANQFSIVFKQKSDYTNRYRLYEINSGCLKDKNTNDCRGGVQYSNIQGNFTFNTGTQIRILDKQEIPILGLDRDIELLGLKRHEIINFYSNHKPIYNSDDMINFDFYTGWQWALSPHLRIGFETILRREETKKKYRQDQDGQKLDNIDVDFNWLAGVQYRF